MSKYWFKRLPAIGEAVDPDDLEAAAATTLVTHTVDGAFELGDSLIGGSQTISGLVLLCKQQDTLAGDTGADADLYVDAIACNDLRMDTDGDIVGLFDSRDHNNAGFFGINSFMAEFNMAIPSTSYDIKAAFAGTFKRTFIVVILNV